MERNHLDFFFLHRLSSASRSLSCILQSQHKEEEEEEERDSNWNFLYSSCSVTTNEFRDAWNECLEKRQKERESTFPLYFPQPLSLQCSWCSSHCKKNMNCIVFALLWKTEVTWKGKSSMTQISLPQFHPQFHLFFCWNSSSRNRLLLLIEETSSVGTSNKPRFCMNH